MTGGDQSEEILRALQVEKKGQKEPMLHILDGGAHGGKGIPADDFFNRPLDWCHRGTVFSCKDTPGSIPLAKAPEMTDAVLENEEAAFQIEFPEHFHHQIRIVRGSCLLQDIKELLPSGRQGVLLHRIECNMGRQIGELRAGSRIGVRTDHNRHRGCLQVEEGMNTGPPRGDWHGAACFQQGDITKFQISETKVGGDRLWFLKIIGRVNTRSGHDMEGTGKLVLMDIGRSVQPEESLNVELRIVVQDQLRLTEPRGGLEGLIIMKQEFMDNFLQIDILRRTAFLEGLAGDFREKSQVEVNFLPLRVHRISKFLEKGIHTETLSQPPVCDKNHYRETRFQGFSCRAFWSELLFDQ